MSLGRGALNRRNVENRRCSSCQRGMAMVNNPNGGRYCRWCGFDPLDPRAPEDDPELFEHYGPCCDEGTCHEVPS